MWQKIKIALWRTTFRLALRRASPDRIPMSGDRVYERNYHTAYLGDADDAMRFVVMGVTSEGVTGRWYGGEGGDQPWVERTIPDAEIPEYRLFVLSYIREIEVRYTSALDFVLHQSTGFQWLLLARERVRKFMFNRKKLVREDRIAVLRTILDSTLRNQNFRTSSIGLMTHLYGVRWTGHPDNEVLHEYYDLLLNSLADSGDLLPDNHNFRLAPQALATLAAFEEDNRKHWDMVRIQTIVAFATAALFIVGLVQAYITYMGNNPTP